MKSRAKLWRSYILWGIASIAVTLGPLAAVLIVNRSRYFTAPRAGLKLTVAGVMCVLFLALLLFEKIKAPGSVFWFTFVFVLACLLDPLLKDMRLLAGMALAGKVTDWVFVTPRVRRCRELIRTDEQANASAKATAATMEDVLKQYVGRV